MQNKEHLRAMEKTWVHSLPGKHDLDGAPGFLIKEKALEKAAGLPGFSDRLNTRGKTVYPNSGS